METEEQFTDDDLILKIYSNGQEYEPIIIQSNDRVYQVGRSDKCDVYIKDRMLSRIHCLLVFIDNNWYIKEGDENYTNKMMLRINKIEQRNKNENIIINKAEGYTSFLTYKTTPEEFKKM